MWFGESIPVPMCVQTKFTLQMHEHNKRDMFADLFVQVSMYTVWSENIITSSKNFMVKILKRLYIATQTKRLKC